MQETKGAARDVLEIMADCERLGEKAKSNVRTCQLTKIQGTQRRLLRYTIVYLTLCWYIICSCS